MKYRVYFEQVNQQVIEIEADHECNAVRKACKKWLQDVPLVLDVQHQTETVSAQEDPV